MSEFSRHGFDAAGLLAAVAMLLPLALSAQEIDPTRYAQLQSRHIGPL